MMMKQLSHFEKPLVRASGSASAPQPRPDGSVWTEVLKHGYDENSARYCVVHPLDDIPEEKIDTGSLGQMPMTSAVKWSLLSLRAYLILMFVMVSFRVLQLAGVFGVVR